MEKPVNRHQSSDITLNNICSNDNDHEDGQDENNDISMTLFMERSLAGNYVIQDKKIKYINPAASEYSGYEAKELLNKNADCIIHPDDIKSVKSNVLAMLKKQRTSSQEFRIVKKDGEIRWIREIVSSISYQGRRAILGNVVDITEQKLAEEALQESRRRLGDLIEFLPDATFAIDLEGRLIAWNRSAEELTDIKAQHILGKRNYEYARPFWKNRRPMTLDLILHANKKYGGTYNVFNRERNLAIVETYVPGITIKGENAYLWGKAGPLYDSKGNIIGSIEVIRDITQHKLAKESILKREQQLQLKSQELEELNTALKVLLDQRENDKEDLEERLMMTVEELVFPYINELKKRQLDDSCKSYVNILEKNLQNILSPFASKISSKYLKLTNREIRIAGLINEGWSSKEIADLLKVSPSSVNIYRYRIRKKLGLKKDENLRTFLSRY